MKSACPRFSVAPGDGPQDTSLWSSVCKERAWDSGDLEAGGPAPLLALLLRGHFSLCFPDHLKASSARGLGKVSWALRFLRRGGLTSETLGMSHRWAACTGRL